ncbi:MAG: DUF6077 domain-containing protein [Microlunatus sp.]
MDDVQERSSPLLEADDAPPGFHPPSPEQVQPWWPLAIDGACDGIVLCFAGWTIFYELALIGGFSILWTGWPLITLSVLVIAWYGHRTATAPQVPQQPRIVRSPAARWLDWRILVGGAVVFVALVAGRQLWGAWPAALVAIGIVVVQLLPWLRPEPEQHRSSVPAAAPGHRSHWAALAMSLGLGVFGSHLLRPNADDVYYVNRATWVAEHGTVVTGDTMFSPNTERGSFGGGFPTASVEAGQGVLAHALGIQAPTLCYLVLVPLLGALAGWTMWRLMRAWGTRRHALAMAAAMVFVLASAGIVVGDYSIGRIWQGKAAAYAIVLPMVWLLLSRVIRQARRSDLVLLGAAGIAFVGLTTTSALVAPVISFSALTAALLLRSQSLATGAVVFLVAPFVNGLVQAFGPADIGSGGGDLYFIGATAAFDIAFGGGLPKVLLAMAALLLVPRLVPGPAGIVLACGVLVTMVTILPGMFELANALTGAGPVIWRLLITLPTAVLVGLLVTLPGGGSPPPRQLTRLLAALVVTAFLVPTAWGTWLWRAPESSLTLTPTWKVDQSALADLRAAESLDPAPGLWLMPPKQMQILTLTSVEQFAVVPRAYYLPALPAPPQEIEDRTVLLNLVMGESVQASQVRFAIRRLDVSLACVPAADIEASATLRRAVRKKLKSVGEMDCYWKERYG